MKSNLKKLSLVMLLAIGTTFSLSSCGGDKEAEGEKKCEEGKCEEGKCEEGKKCEGEKKCEEGGEKKCEGGDSTAAAE